MKKCIAILAGCIFLLAFACNTPEKSASAGTDRPKLKSGTDRDSYALGYNTGMNLKEKDLLEMIDFQIFQAGLRDAVTGQQPQLPVEDIQSHITRLNQAISQIQREKFLRTAEEQKKISEEFLKKNARTEGVQVTESGLQYMIISPGTGPRPDLEDTVKVHYRGMLIDGTVFDSSIKRGQPAEFSLRRVIAGWTEGIQLMRKGARYRFFIPSDLAYDLQPPRGSLIPPNATLIFDVELLAVVTTENPEKN